MSFKKHNPGCPCSCGEEPPSGPCGCDGGVEITISNAQLLWEWIGVRFSPGPCNYIQWTGIDAIEGVYNITLTNSNQEFELVRVAATNNPEADDFFNEYCLYVRLRVEYLGDPVCQIAFWVDFKVELLSGGSCTPLEDVDFSTADSWAFTNDNFNAYTDVCTDQSGTVEVQTYADITGDCATKYYTFDYVIDYA